MSCHLSHRLTTVHRAVSMALLCSVGYVALLSSAQAATIGKTVVTSTQHEPLAASIVVTDIRAADFSASLANPIIYQQMGLSPTDSMTVRFTPTSETSGQVFITTSKPVSKPFADVVLAINDKGQSNVVPKTLLMPLNNSLPMNPSKNIVTGAKKPNLPSVSASTATPLTVRKGAPPPLMSTPTLSAPQPQTSELLASKSPAPRFATNSIQTNSIQAPVVTSTLQSTNLSYAPSRLDNGRLNSNVDIKNSTDDYNANGDNRTPASRLDNARFNTNEKAMTVGGSNIDINSAKNSANNLAANKTLANDTAPIGTKAIAADDKTVATVITDKQLDILNIQVTRQIQPTSKSDNGVVANSPSLLTPNNNQTNASKTNLDANNMTEAASMSNIPPNTVASVAPKIAPEPSVSGNLTTSNATVQYQVQRNDSLWVIAQQIAQENNLDIQTVMKQIKAQNPTAFINEDAGQLKADAKLSLPSYDVIPSQKKLETAISAQRQYSRKADTPAVKKTVKASPKKSSEMTQAAKQREKPITTKTQTLPKAQFSVLAPNHNGSADGTQTKSAATKGNGLSTDILATLKSSRQSTASQAQSLSKTSSALDSYTKKIQLQNQKLAELQARLKKLRNQ